MRTTFTTVNSIQCQILDLNFAIKYRKVSFCLFLTFLEGENWKSVNSLVTHNCTSLSIYVRVSFFFVNTRKTLIVLECCTVFSILDMFTIWHKTITKYKIRTIFFVVVWLFCFGCIGGPVHLRKETGEKGSELTFWKYSNKDIYIYLKKKWSNEV